jgi:hypothetical protein
MQADSRDSKQSDESQLLFRPTLHMAYLFVDIGSFG